MVISETCITDVQVNQGETDRTGYNCNEERDKYD